MPELPDVTIYVERLEAYTVGQSLERVRLQSSFLLRSVEPPLNSIEGQTVIGVKRLGKRIVFGFENDIFMVLHLMIAGRLRWKKRGAKVPIKSGLAGFDFPKGTLLLTEASTKKRASMHLVEGLSELTSHERGGLEVLDASFDDFKCAITRSNHTLKRALTDPRILSAIGNAYSDEILFAAKMSPFKQTQKLTDLEIRQLHQHTVGVLNRFTEAIRHEVGEKFPDKVTAFRDDMYVHGRYRESCKICGSKIQRVAYAENEMNYCPNCQNAGRLLADRSLSRLMKRDWPKTAEELEQIQEPPCL